MNYHNIVHEDMLNGDGLRVTLFVSGCPHHCPECHNPQTWDYDSGIPFDTKAKVEIVRELRKEHISGITISGGDPLAPENRRTIFEFLTYIRSQFPDKSIWLYTGYNFEDLVFRGNFYHVSIFKLCDVVVDGNFINHLKDPKLKWRGSKNQRVIDVQKSLQTGHLHLWCD